MSYNGLCRLDLEDRKLLELLPELPMKSGAWGDFVRPKKVGVDWHKTENQGQIGSCQGNGLTSCLERLHYVKTKEIIQLSRIFAYLATQKLDGLLGQDQGSTISRGIELAIKYGVCLENLTGYPNSYPNKSTRDKILTTSNYEAGKDYQAKSSWKVPSSVENCADFIGGGGAISYGIVWYQGIIPKDRIVREFNPRGKKILGGHANAALGYEEDLRIIGMNSHGDGPYWITPEAWIQMLKHNQTSAIGLMGSQEPVPVDWVKDNPWV